MIRAWKRNVLGLSRWEVEHCHQTRLDATAAIAELMRQGRSFADAKAEIIRRADRIYRHGRPELVTGLREMARAVSFDDMPRDVVGKIEADFLISVESARGYRLGRLERLLYRMTGMVWRV